MHEQEKQLQSVGGVRCSQCLQEWVGAISMSVEQAVESDCLWLQTLLLVRRWQQAIYSVSVREHHRSGCLWGQAMWSECLLQQDVKLSVVGAVVA